jgi:hypothetical protein
MEDVQPGKITGRIENFGGSNVAVASGAGVGRSWVSRMTWQTMRGCQGGNHCETWPKLQHWRSGLQVPLMAEREGFMRLVSQRAVTVEDIWIHMLRNAAA